MCSQLSVGRTTGLRRGRERKGGSSGGQGERGGSEEKIIGPFIGFVDIDNRTMHTTCRYIDSS